MAVIETKGLTKYYGKNRGITDVSLAVNEGEIYGFIGPNGAGKSTMIKTLLNMIFPTKGSASIFGLDCVADARSIKAKLALISEYKLRGASWWNIMNYFPQNWLVVNSLYEIVRY
jgi:ABC-2 type transport system ATP-binding protein